MEFHQSNPAEKGHLTHAYLVFVNLIVSNLLFGNTGIDLFPLL